MVPHDDVDFSQQALLRHHRTQVVFKKVPLVRRLKHARFPRLGRHRLVLDRDAPHRYAFLPVALDELREIASPGAGVLETQVSTVQHVIVVFHERRRAPGTGKELEPVAAGRHRALDQGDPVAQVVRDGERLQVLVALVDIRVALAREVTAVDVGPAQGVPDPAVGAVIGSDQFVLWGRGQFREGLGRGIGQGSADSNERLKRSPRIDEDVDLSLGCRLRRRERQRIGRRQPESGALGRGVDDRAPLSSGLLSHDE